MGDRLLRQAREIADEHFACPFCFGTRSKTQKVEADNRLIVKEICSTCRRTIVERNSTAKIEKVRDDIIRLRAKAEPGTGLYDVLQDRINTYRKLTHGS